MSIFDLSFRYKIPLWGSVLIVTTAVAVAASLMVQAYDDLRTDLVNRSASLGRTLSEMIFHLIPQGDVWHAFEVVHAPFHEAPPGDLIRPKMIVALDNQQQVFVSSHPTVVPILADYRQLGEEQARLVERIAARLADRLAVIEFHGAESIYIATPIAKRQARLGTLVIVHSKDVFLPRFTRLALRGAVIGLLVLAVLLPISWYWGALTATPLVNLARSADQIARGHMPQSIAGKYPYRDELGRLFAAFGVMMKSLREKVVLEREMIRSERLAAIGRLAAGIAHEINNPLGGMLGALDNFKHRGGHDERTLKTASLIERGLIQIRDTVRAILVEAKVKSRDLVPQDIEDVQMLMLAETHQRAVTIDMENGVAQTIALPATLVRQILMNLLLNAVHASEPSGVVCCRITTTGDKLRIETENSGPPITTEIMDRLFEPFVVNSEAGHGLGLWVTYQIASQLGGRIWADRVDGRTRFVVELPCAGGQSS